MTLNANLAKLEATRDKLTEELKVLADEINKQLLNINDDSNDSLHDTTTTTTTTITTTELLYYYYYYYYYHYHYHYHYYYY